VNVKFRRDLLVLLFFTILTLLLTWPLITQLGSVYAGNNEDLWTFQWDNWWTRYALQHGADMLFTPVQFYPVGVSLAAHSLSFYNSLLWIPLAALFGDIAAYNITVLLTFILSGYTMFKLVEYVQGSVKQRSVNQLIRDQETDAPITDHRSLIPALIAGLIFAFAPYHFSQSLGHVSLASVQWFPLLALFILKATRETKRRNVIWIGLTTLLITATRLQFLVLGGVVMALFVLVDWLVLRREWARDARGRGAWTRLIAGAALGLVLSLPIVLPAAQLYTQAASPDELIADEQTWGQTDLAAYFVPMTYHPVFGSIVQPLYENFVKNRAWMPYLGFVPLALAVWGTIRVKRRALPWVAVGVFCFVMALGPFLRVNGAELTNIPLPYALVGDRFPLNILRSPDRYNLLLPLALAPLAAWGAQDVLTRLQARAHSQRLKSLPGNENALKRVTAIGGAILGALILFEYLGLPYPTIEPLPTSPFQQQMAQDGAEYAVLDIPLDRSDTKRYLYYQTQHGKPTVQGRVARVPEAAYELFRRIPLLSAWQTDILAQRPLELGAQLQPLADIDVRYIILHKDLAPQRAMPALRDYFTLPPVYEDDQIAVYSTAPSTQPAQALTDEIGVANSWVAVEGPDKPLRVRVRWTAAQSIEQELAYRLEVIDEAGAAVISQTDWLSPSTSSWLTGTIVIGNYSLTPAQPIPIGRYRLRLSVLDDDGVLGAIELPHRIVNVPSLTGDWIMPVSEEPRVRFDPAIELPAADVSRRGNWLSLWLHWYARTAPGRDAKYFVHLLDEQGNVVLQEDGIHKEWTRPTSTWQADEMLSDLIELPLWNLPPGEYRIAVGLTNPDTGERLPTVDAAGNALPDNRYIFEETIRMD
jgi:hypothetical protein